MPESSSPLPFALQHAVQAPSGHNSQPWIFTTDPQGRWLELRGDTTRSLPIVDRDGRELTISCGAALLNVRLALSHLSVPHTVEFVGSPECLVRVHLQTGRVPPYAADEILFEAIPERRTYRFPFAERPVEEGLWKEFQRCAAQEGAALERQDDAGRVEVARLIEEADLQLAIQPRYRTELAAWMRAGHTEPGPATVYDEFTTSLAPLLLRFLNSGTQASAHDRRLALEAPLLVVLTTPGDTLEDWFKAGQAMQRVLLRAAADGAQASYLNQALALPETRSLLPCTGVPQLVLRMGYQRQRLRPTPRRPLEEMHS